MSTLFVHPSSFYCCKWAFSSQWETKLSEALNQHEVIVLKMVHFEAFDTAKMVTLAGQLLVLQMYG